jgi:putative ABC transport system permease protein
VKRNAHTADMNASRLTGMGAFATLALAVLVFGCVLAAAAGPREALKTRTQALHQTLAPVPPLQQAISVTSTWSQLSTSVALPQATFSNAELNNLAGQFHASFTSGDLHLAPASADWWSMTSPQQSVLSPLSGAGHHPVDMEVSYRLPLTRYVRVLAGSLSAVSLPRSTNSLPVITVAVTQQTARRFDLQVGSVVRVLSPPSPAAGPMAIAIDVAAVVAERQPGSAFWQADPTLAAPELNVPGVSPPYWTSGVFALPGESAVVQLDYGQGVLSMLWVLPINFRTVLGDQVVQLEATLQRILTEFPQLRGPLAPAASAVMVSTGVQQVLASFIQAAESVDVLLWLLYVSLGLTAAIVLLLTARMIVLRRAAELGLRRARGASLVQIGLAAGRGAAIGCGPAAVLAGAAAVLLVPTPAPPGGWWPALVVLVFAVCAPAVLGAWQQRLPRSGRGRAAGGYSRPGQTGSNQPSLSYGALGYGRRSRRRFRGGVRLVVEVTAVLASIAGIVVLRHQGTQAGASVDLYTSAAPALVAIPAVIVVLRIYPLILRGLLRGAARGRGATGFLGLAQAARAALTPALPAFALVVAITVAAFAGMVRDAVNRGEINASWQAAGADVTISNTGPANSLPAAAQRAFAGVPGIEHAAVVSEWAATAQTGAQVTALAVDPASYAALVASSQTWPAVDSGLLTGHAVLASPKALADFRGAKTVTLTTDNGVAPLRVQVAGVVSGTPALPAGGAFVLVPESLVAHDPFVVPNVMLLNGPSIEATRLTALVHKLVPTAIVTIRSKVLSQLTGAPVQRGAFLLFALALLVAAALGLAVMVLQLALGAADREATLARLATMGLGEAKRTRLVLLEVLPPVAAAAVAAVAAALVLPRIVAPVLNLSVFTGSVARVRLLPDAASLALPIAGLIVIAAVALTIEMRARRGVVSTLRGGE